MMTHNRPARPFMKVRDAQIWLASFAGIPEGVALCAIEREIAAQRAAITTRAPEPEWCKGVALLERAVSHLKNLVELRSRGAVLHWKTSQVSGNA